MSGETIEPIISTLSDEGGAVVKLIKMFIDKLPKDLAEIQHFYEARDWEKFSKNIHSLKGTGGNFGFDQLSQESRQIEALVADGSYDMIAIHLLKLKILCERIQAGISCYRG